MNKLKYDANVLIGEAWVPEIHEEKMGKVL